VRLPDDIVARRRLAGLAALAALLLLAGVVACAVGGGDDGDRAASAAKQPPPRPELPRGGREILPRYRVVAYYGAPQAAELGILGIGSPDSAVRKLNRQAKAYERKKRPVMPVLELIAVVAAAHPGEDGRYNMRQPDSVIRKYLRAARRAKALLVLDIQPGRADFFTETTRLRKYLKEPDVGLALDPEWRVTDSEVPGQVIGKVDSRELNATTAWLDQLTERNDLPQKMLLIHQFTDDMVDEKQLKARDNLAIVLNADGFGSPPAKISKYDLFTGQATGFHHGFKLFYKEDQPELMSPRRVLRLKPAPDVVVYE
jgi:hypothetical protein